MSWEVNNARSLAPAQRAGALQECLGEPPCVRLESWYFLLPPFGGECGRRPDEGGAALRAESMRRPSHPGPLPRWTIDTSGRVVRGGLGIAIPPTFETHTRSRHSPTCSLLTMHSAADTERIVIRLS